MRECDLDELLIIFADACELFEYIYDDCHARLLCWAQPAVDWGACSMAEGEKIFFSLNPIVSRFSLIHLKRNLIRASERMMMEIV